MGGEGEIECETCQDTGQVDERLGRIDAGAGVVPCPDCDQGWPIMTEAQRGERILWRFRGECSITRRKALE